jgi:hypothetical protein
MDRRRFLLTPLAGALAVPHTAGAEQVAKVYRVCFLALTPGEDTTSMKPLVEWLHELGYSEGRAGGTRRQGQALPGRPPRCRRVWWR